MMKKRPSEMILDIYRTNKSRLANELGKDVKDRSAHNAIAAYKHILHHMEETYDIPEV